MVYNKGSLAVGIPCLRATFRICMIVYIMRSQKEDMEYKYGVGYVDSVLA
jgi:hypothetical protein